MVNTDDVSTQDQLDDTIEAFVDELLQNNSQLTKRQIQISLDAAADELHGDVNP